MISAVNFHMLGRGTSIVMVHERSGVRRCPPLSSCDNLYGHAANVGHAFAAEPINVVDPYFPTTTREAAAARRFDALLGMMPRRELFLDWRYAS